MNHKIRSWINGIINKAKSVLLNKQKRLIAIICIMLVLAILIVVPIIACNGTGTTAVSDGDLASKTDEIITTTEVKPDDSDIDVVPSTEPTNLIVSKVLGVVVTGTKPSNGSPLSKGEFKFKKGEKISINDLQKEFDQYKTAAALGTYETGVTTLIIDWGGRWNELVPDGLVVRIDYASGLSCQGAEDWGMLNDEGEIEFTELTENDKNLLGEITDFLWTRESIENSRGIKIGMTAGEVCDAYSNGAYVQGHFGYGDSDDMFQFLCLYDSLMLHARDFDSVYRVFTSETGKLNWKFDSVGNGEVFPEDSSGREGSAFYFRDGKLIAISESYY